MFVVCVGFLSLSLTHLIVFSGHPVAVTHCNLLNLNIFSALPLSMFDYPILPLVVFSVVLFSLEYKTLM